MVRDVVIIVAQSIRQDENGIERRERIVAPIRKRRKKKKTKKGHRGYLTVKLLLLELQQSSRVRHDDDFDLVGKSFALY